MAFLTILLNVTSMITNYFTLLALCDELKPVLCGTRVSEIYSQRKSQLIITFRPESGEDVYSLCVSVEPNLSYCFLSNRFTRARRNAIDLFSSLITSVLIDISVVPYERTLRLSFSNGLFLLIRLFNTADSNVLALNQEDVIVEAFKNNKNLRSRVFPRDDPRFDVRSLTDWRQFATSIQEHRSAPALTALKLALPILGTDLAIEMIYRAALDARRPVSELASVELLEVFDHIRTSLVENLTPIARIYTRRDKTRVFSIIEFRHLSGPQESFDSVSVGIQELVKEKLAARKLVAETTTLDHKLESELRCIQRSVKRIHSELQKSDRRLEYEHIGKLIMANLHRITKGMGEIEAQDIFADFSTVIIHLEPHLTPVQNAEKYFEMAKKSKKKDVEKQRQYDQANQKLDAVTRLLEELKKCRSEEEVNRFCNVHEKELRSMKIVAKGREKDVPPFRLFTVAGGFEVWVGKNSTNNDLLTMKYAKPNDLWFHARGGSGSHTVLRVHATVNPPKEAISQAAAIAAYYSKMRNTRNVPVAYCERKFVRKPKGSNAGTVVLERETVIFVEPGLPRVQPSLKKTLK